MIWGFAMKAISIWQPYASLIVTGHKFTETRGWPAPKSLIGSRIAIASTKKVRPEQCAVMQDPEFRRYYDETGLPEIEDLPHGYVLGMVTLHSCAPITEEDLEDITDEERLYGWWEIGRYAWRLRHPEEIKEPVSVRGAQGVWDWRAHEVLKDPNPANQEGPAALRRHLRVVERH